MRYSNTILRILQLLYYEIYEYVKIMSSEWSLIVLSGLFLYYQFALNDNLKYEDIVLFFFFFAIILNEEIEMNKKAKNKKINNLLFGVIFGYIGALLTPGVMLLQTYQTAGNKAVFTVIAIVAGVFAFIGIILSTILLLIMLRKIKVAPGGILGLGIVMIIFCSVLGGIFAIQGRNEIEDKKKQEQTIEVTTEEKE